VIPHGMEVYVALDPIDLRWGFDRLAGLVTERLGRGARSGALFVLAACTTIIPVAGATHRAPDSVTHNRSRSAFRITTWSVRIAPARAISGALRSEGPRRRRDADPRE
jgi:hypothetical protein